MGEQERRLRDQRRPDQRPPATPGAANAHVNLALALQRSAGNHATASLLARGGHPVIARGPPATAAGVPTPAAKIAGDASIEEKWLGALAFKDYREAARVLNGYNDADIRRHVRLLKSEPELEAIMGHADVNGAAADRIRTPLRTELLERRYRKALDKRDWPTAATQLNGFNLDDIRLRLEALAYDDPDALIAVKDAAAAATLGNVMLIVGPIVSSNEPRRVEVWNRMYAQAVAKEDFTRAASLLAAASPDDLKGKLGRLTAAQLEAMEFGARKQNLQGVAEAVAKLRAPAKPGGQAAAGALGDLLKRAGLTDAQIGAARAELGPQGARSMLSDLERVTPALGAYGPRMSAIRILREIVAGGATAQLPELAASRVARLAKLVLMRPDGYLVRADTGAPIQKIPGGARVVDGAIQFGNFAVGPFYYDNTGLLYATNDELQMVGPSVGELHLEHDIANKALDGIEGSVKAMVVGLMKLLKDPIKTLKELATFPSAVKLLIESSPAYWERFKNMTLGDQTEQVANILTTLIGMYGGATAVMRVPGAVAKAGSSALAAADKAMEVMVTTMRLDANGTLVLAQASVRAGVAAPALPGGPFGAVFMVAQANQAVGGDPLADPKDVDAMLDKFGEQDKPGALKPGAPTPVDFHGALAEAWKLLRAEGPVTNNPSNLGTRLHAAIAKVLRGKPMPADWTLAIERPLGDVAGAGSRSVREWLTGHGDPHGFLDTMPKKLLDTAVRDLKPDLVMWEGKSRTLVWDLTSSSKAEHVAKTTLYAEILAKDGVWTRVMETYWSAGAK